jgi:hypothetical protein
MYTFFSLGRNVSKNSRSVEARILPGARDPKRPVEQQEFYFRGSILKAHEVWKNYFLKHQ